MRYCTLAVTIVVLVVLEACLSRAAAFCIARSLRQETLIRLAEAPFALTLLVYGLPSLFVGLVGSRWLGARPVRYAVLVGVMSFVLMLALKWVDFTAYSLRQDGAIPTPLDWRISLRYTFGQAIGIGSALVLGTAMGLWLGCRIIKHKQRRTVAGM